MAISTMVNEKERGLTVLRAKRMFEDGKTVREIAKELKLPESHIRTCEKLAKKN